MKTKKTGRVMPKLSVEYMKDGSSTKIEVEYSRGGNVADLKNTIAKRTNIEAKFQQLKIHGRELLDSEPLSNYVSGITLQLTDLTKEKPMASTTPPSKTLSTEGPTNPQQPVSAQPNAVLTVANTKLEEELSIPLEIKLSNGQIFSFTGKPTDTLGELRKKISQGTQRDPLVLGIKYSSDTFTSVPQDSMTLAECMSKSSLGAKCLEFRDLTQKTQIPEEEPTIELYIGSVGSNMGLSIGCKLTKTVAEVKKRAAAELDREVPALTYRGQELKDTNTLAFYGIKKDAELLATYPTQAEGKATPVGEEKKEPPTYTLPFLSFCGTILLSHITISRCATFIRPDTPLHPMISPLVSLAIGTLVAGYMLRCQDDPSLGQHS